MIPQKGQSVQKTFETVVLAIAQDIYVNMPTGGVTDPITIAITSSTPKYAASIPNPLITGNITGDKIINTGIPSTNSPKIKTKIKIRNKIIFGLLLKVIKKFNAISPKPSHAKVQANALDADITNKAIAVVIEALIRILPKSEKLIFL